MEDTYAATSPAPNPHAGAATYSTTTKAKRLALPTTMLLPTDCANCVPCRRARKKEVVKAAGNVANNPPHNDPDVLAKKTDKATMNPENTVRTRNSVLLNWNAASLRSGKPLKYCHERTNTPADKANDTTTSFTENNTNGNQGKPRRQAPKNRGNYAEASQKQERRQIHGGKTDDQRQDGNDVQKFRHALRESNERQTYQGRGGQRHREPAEARPHFFGNVYRTGIHNPPTTNDKATGSKNASMRQEQGKTTFLRPFRHYFVWWGGAWLSVAWAHNLGG